MNDEEKIKELKEIENLKVSVEIVKRAVENTKIEIDVRDYFPYVTIDASAIPNHCEACKGASLGHSDVIVINNRLEYFCNNPSHVKICDKFPRDGWIIVKSYELPKFCKDNKKEGL